MDWNAVIAISCLCVAIGIGLLMAFHNVNDEERIKRNLEARRAFKKRKNAMLMAKIRAKRD